MTLEQVKRLDAIKEGRRVCVAFLQEGYGVAFVSGRWLARHDSSRVGWEVHGSGAKSVCSILPTDKVEIDGGRSVAGIRVFLRGTRIAVNRENLDAAMDVLKRNLDAGKGAKR